MIGDTVGVACAQNTVLGVGLWQDEMTSFVIQSSPSLKRKKGFAGGWKLVRDSQLRVELLETTKANSNESQHHPGGLFSATCACHRFHTFDHGPEFPTKRLKMRSEIVVLLPDYGSGELVAGGKGRVNLRPALFQRNLLMLGKAWKRLEELVTVLHTNEPNASVGLSDTRRVLGHLFARMETQVDAGVRLANLMEAGLGELLVVRRADKGGQRELPHLFGL